MRFSVLDSLKFMSLRNYFKFFSRLDKKPKAFHVLFLIPAIVKNWRTSYADLARFFKVNRLSSTTLSETLNLPPILLLIVAAKKDFQHLNTCITQAIKHSRNSISDVTLIVPNLEIEDCRAAISGLQLDSTICIIGEDDLIPDDLRLIMKKELKHKYGWALQQLLTLNFVLSSNSSGVLALNADTFILRDQVWLNNNGVQILFRSAEYHAPYYSILRKLFPLLGVNGFSHIAHQMLFQPKLLREVLNKHGFSSEFELMISVLSEFDSDEESPFCIEFEPYAQALVSEYPSRCEIRRFSNASFSEKNDQLGCNEILSIFDGKEVYNSISFHSWAI